MTSFLRRFFNYFYELKNQIAFYPTVISLLGCVLAFGMIYLENNGISKYLLEYTPGLVINDVDTSKTILSTFIGGLISIMVFSFSMVMILLNQASSNFSPRVLPGLISNRRHQVILGIYIGTILYCILILVSIQPVEKNYYPPGFAVLVSIILMTSSLGAFIYFIHSISQAIQVNNILKNIFNTAKTRLESIIEKEKDNKTSFPDTSSWSIYRSKQSGYVHSVSLEQMADIAVENNTQISIIPRKGEFVMEGNPLFKSKKDLDDQIEEDISSQFLFGLGELIENNYILAFNQITEIAVKAMSPGINDPGTAINAIDYLTRLFALRSEKRDNSVYHIEDKALIEITTIDFDQLLYNIMASLRTYCKHDVIIVRKLIIMLQHLLQYSKCHNEGYKKSIEQEITLLMNDAEATITNEIDISNIKALLN